MTVEAEGIQDMQKLYTVNLHLQLEHTSIYLVSDTNSGLNLTMLVTAIDALEHF